MEAAYSMPLDTEGTLRERIANAPLPVRTRYEALMQEADEIDADTFIRMRKLSELKEKIDTLAVVIAQAEREQERTGVEYYSAERTYDSETGEESVVRKRTGYVEKLKAEFESMRQEYRLTSEKQRKRKWLAKADEGLTGRNVRLVANPNPIDCEPDNEESETERHDREWRAVEHGRKEFSRVQNAPLTRAEAKAAIDGWVDRMAAAGRPDLGGFIRGMTVSPRGGLQVGNPLADVGWQQLFVTQNVIVPDFNKSIAWLTQDVLKARLHSDVDATYSDKGAISAKDRGPLLAKIEADLWEARRRCEAAYLACRAAGIRNRNRPSDTPWEILLDVLPAAQARKTPIQNADSSSEVESKNSDENEV